ncbi:MAG TPA: Xaa-Pro peptidase family protein [Tepidiformaceae bacterium]|nr:Xaa-Pro peptidase family protein [Tepidiformaceae bacterium]
MTSYADPVDFVHPRRLHEPWLTFPAYPLLHELTKDEYDLRVRRARREMADHSLDALVITSSAVGGWFTGRMEPHEWHDVCQARSTWYILTHDRDFLLMPPTTGGEHFSTTRRSSWVTEISGVVEWTEWPRWELWALEQIPGVFVELKVDRGRLGFELGDCMTLGITVNDFLRLRELLPHAEFVDGAPAIRRLMSIHTPDEIDRVRRACTAAVWMHEQVPQVLRRGMTERAFVDELARRFAGHFQNGYRYDRETGWDVRNSRRGDSNPYHAAATDRQFQDGDLVARGTSGVSYAGYGGDVDRMWHLGTPPKAVVDWYRTAWECSRAMAEQIRPGNRCSDIYAACAKVEQQHGRPRRQVGRVGHGLRNTGGLSVFPTNHTLLEPGMIISVEPMTSTEYGWVTVEEQFLVTTAGAEALHPLAPEHLPIVMS